MYVYDKLESIRRAFFLANIKYELYDHPNIKKVTKNIDIFQCLKIKFNNLKQIERVIPIINDILKTEGFSYPYYVIDQKCKEFFGD